MTDVTGFGLLGHLHSLARESGVAAEIDAAAVPAIHGVADLLGDAEAVSGGSRRNADYAADFATFDPAVPVPGGGSCATPPRQAACWPAART